MNPPTGGLPQQQQQQPKSPSGMGATTTAPWAGPSSPMPPPAAPWVTPAPSMQAPTAAPWAQQAGSMGSAAGAPSGANAAPIGSSQAPKVAPSNIVEASPGVPSMVLPMKEHEYLAPRKRIGSGQDLTTFLESETLKEYIGFLMACSDSVKGKKLSSECQITRVLSQMCTELDTLSAAVDDIPPHKVELRFGNPAYREWFARMQKDSQQAMARILPEHLQGAALELSHYWADSFGNVVRIDYGTGHETTFAVLLFCLAKIGALTKDCLQAVVTRVFAKYIQLMRKLQTTYWLEPAGSHGVWGLDDYQFLPFYWGAAQLIGHQHIKPKSIHNEEVLEGFSGEYLYLGCVAFVKQVKKGNLCETSPMLNDISGVPGWPKVNSGMMKMYQAEVLAKLPIMQHMLFGSLLSFPFDE